MNQRARSKSWMPMSTMMPPLLAGFAYSRLGRNGSRERRFEDHRPADGALGDFLLRGRVPGIEPAHETHLKERSRLSTASAIAGTPRDSAPAAFRRTSASSTARPRSRFPMRVGGADDDDGIDVRDRRSSRPQRRTPSARRTRPRRRRRACDRCPRPRRRWFPEYASPDRGRRPCRAVPRR